MSEKRPSMMSIFAVIVRTNLQEFFRLTDNELQSLLMLFQKHKTNRFALWFRHVFPFP